MRTWWRVGWVVLLVTCGNKQGPVQGFSHGIAVVNSDYHSTSLSLLDPNDNSVADPCLSSGSTSPRLSLALSGDVVLPSQSGVSGTLALVDRGNSSVVWLNPGTCSVQRQLAVAPGFKGNPHDYLEISATQAYVTLFDAAPQGLAGNSVLVVNPQSPNIVSSIIVSTLATQDSNGLATLARPDRAVFANNTVYVTLGNISANLTSYGPGRVVIIDPNTNQIVNHIDISSGRGCSGMAAAGNVLVVGCDGDMSNPAQIFDSGVFVYDISAPRAPTLTNTITATQIQRNNIHSNALAVADDHVYFVATAAVDAVYEDNTLLMAAAGAHELGSLVVAGGDMYVADADSSHPAVIQAQGASVLQRINSAPHSLLPPRSLLVY